MRILLPVMIFTAIAFGQSRETTLSLEVRPQCGIMESSFTPEPGTAEGVIRIRYVARTGPQGGKFLMSPGRASGVTLVRPSIAGPALAPAQLTLEGNGVAVLARIQPHSHTPKSGAAGEINLRWLSAPDISTTPQLRLVCP